MAKTPPDCICGVHTGSSPLLPYGVMTLLDKNTFMLAWYSDIQPRVFSAARAHVFIQEAGALNCLLLCRVKISDLSQFLIERTSAQVSKLKQAHH